MNKTQRKARNHNSAVEYLSLYVYLLLQKTHILISHSYLVISVGAVESARSNAAVPKETMAVITVN